MLAVLAVLVAGACWIATTPTGSGLLSKIAVKLSRSQLTLDGVEGPLSGPIRIRKLVFTSATKRITLERVRLEWQPRALLHGRLDVGLLAAQTVRVDILKTDPTPLALPATLRLPVDVRVATWDVAHLDVVDAGQTFSFSSTSGRSPPDGSTCMVTVAISPASSTRQCR